MTLPVVTGLLLFAIIVVAVAVTGIAIGMLVAPRIQRMMDTADRGEEDADDGSG